MKATDQAESNHRFKFLSLKVYTSTEWLADNKKKYRQVFDHSEVSFVYAELCLANKLFDQEEWNVEVELRCYNSKKNQKICELHYSKAVPKTQQSVYIREGWGNKQQGSFWKKGTYYWEVWIENKKIATKYFYIEESDAKTSESQDKLSDRYATVRSIRLFEGSYDDVPHEDRKYLKVFNAEETSYVYAEIELNNINRRRKWHCELFVKFYNSARELKGQVVKLVRVQGGDEGIYINAGWGASKSGSWREGKYTAEFVFMDELIAICSFEVSNHALAGDAKLLLPGWPNFLLPGSSENLKNLGDWQGKLNALIGLQEIKEKVEEHRQFIEFLKLRHSKGIKENRPIDIHSVFIGNPGTGKTTVAQMMGRLYHNMGLLSKGHVHEVDRVDLVGEYIGQTAPKVKEAIESARGGVLFIDEAYALARKNDDAKDFGKEVIEILIKELSNGDGDLAVIVAGYPEEMKYFLDSNPGLKSRFKHFFEFRDYLPEELFQIGLQMAVKENVNLSAGAKSVLKEQILKAFRSRDKSFGNARYVEDLIEKSKINLGLRVMKSAQPEELTKRELKLVLKEDVIKTSRQIGRPKLKLPIDRKELEDARTELHEMIGMSSVKKSVEETIQLVQYHLSKGEDVLNHFNLHTLLIGNPGTGKTTVARILARIYSALGIIERGTLYETDRQGLVAGYVGQTAIKTKKVIESALGGVLFIDEAYALTQSQYSDRGDFGGEVIQTLIKQMEDKKGEFFLFAAGYPFNMEQFLNSNPGFKSRFDQLLFFEDYNRSELLDIFKLKMSKAGYEVEEEALELIRAEIDLLYMARDQYFGNARRIRQLVEQIIKNHNIRMSSSEGSQSDKIQVQDIYYDRKNPSEWKSKRSHIGFRSSGDEN